MNSLPCNLLEAIRYFSNLDNSFQFVKNLRWPDKIVICPFCEYNKTSFLTTRRIWKCLSCKRQFSIKVGTIFEGSPLGFDKWLPAIWLIANSKNGISSYELSRALGITQKSAWFMLHRIREAMRTKSFKKMDGIVEVDETYIGGQSKNMHINIRNNKITGTGGSDKVAIQGALERSNNSNSSTVHAEVVESTDRHTLQSNVRKWAESGATVYTDEARAYIGLDNEFAHKSVNHSREFVSGDVYTNGIENFWSLYKRAWKGTYTHNSKEHTVRYVNERSFSFNNRKESDFERMEIATKGTNNRRITWKELTKKSA